MLQIIVDLGHLWGSSFALRIYGYGFMLVLGFLLGIKLAQWCAKRMGENPDMLVRCGILALIGGIVGARLAYIIERVYYGERPSFFYMIDITSGGLIYYGGVVLAVIVLLAYLWAKKLPIRRFLDILAPSLMIGLAFGRAGCTLNGCCYGQVCDENWPLAIKFPMYSKPLLKINDHTNPYSENENPSPPYSDQFKKGLVKPDPSMLNGDWFVSPQDFTPAQIRIAELTESLAVKPSQPLSMIGALLLAGLLMAFTRLRNREGQVFAAMIVAYPIMRFAEEATREHASGLSHNQITSIILIVIGLVMFALLQKAKPSAGPSWAGRETTAAPVPQNARAKSEKQKRK